MKTKRGSVAKFAGPAASGVMRGGSRTAGVAIACVALTVWLAGCQTPAPVVHVQAPPCNCECAYRATAPQIGKGCWVEGDRLICPLVRRSLELEPAYPSDDPRCERRPDGTLSCTVDPGE